MVIRLNDLTPDDSTFPNGYHIRLVKFQLKKKKLLLDSSCFIFILLATIPKLNNDLNCK